MAEPSDEPTRDQNERQLLDHDRKSPKARHFADQLAARIVGQEPAVGALTGLYEMFLAGMNPPRRPIGTLLFLGPTGSGKTRVVEAAAEVLFGDAGAVLKVDCAEFQHAHEIARLIGPPPGYVGHKETAPLLSQQNLDRFHIPAARLSILLFDEIEKASEALWQLLLGILDRATLTLGDGRRVDFSRTIIVMTSNLGAAEMGEVVSGGLGFGSATNSMDERRLNKTIQRTGLDAARRRFSPEFMNRIDKSIVFRSLSAEDLRRILDLELQAVQSRLRGAKGAAFRFCCTEGAKGYLLAEGTNSVYGARHLKRAIERHLVEPLSTLVATEQVQRGDIIEVELDANGTRLLFSRCSIGELISDFQSPVEADAASLPTDTLSDEEARVAATIVAATAAALTGVIIQLVRQQMPSPTG